MIRILAIAIVFGGCSGRASRQATTDGAADTQSQVEARPVTSDGGTAPGFGGRAQSTSGGNAAGGSGGQGGSIGFGGSQGTTPTGGAAATEITSTVMAGGAAALGGKMGSGGIGDSGGVIASGGAASGGAGGSGGMIARGGAAPGGVGGGGATARGGVSGGGTAGLGGSVGSGGVGGGGAIASGGVASGGSAGTTSRVSCQEGETSCLGTFYLRRCKGGNFIAEDTCGEHQTCASVGGIAQCVCDVDPDCAVAGLSCAGTSTLVTCSRDPRSCLYKSTSVCNERICSGPDASASCCTRACTVGTTGCATSTAIGSCALAANGCSAYTVTQTCAEGLVCGEHNALECFDSRWADWPMPNSAVDVGAGAPNPASFTDNDDGTITDNVTKLMWQKGEVHKGLSWSDAVAHCSTMALAGHRDWRLPSHVELMSIVDHSRTPTIDLTFFPGTLRGPYWASTPTVNPLGWMALVEFRAGFIDFEDKSIVANVRCVRR